MSDIFVSYARSSAPHAKAIAAELAAVGYDVWMDDALPVHRAYAEVIEEQLKDVKVVLVVWSEDAAKSNWVRAEADLGLGQDKLVQLSIDGVVPPIPFNQIECADLTGWTGASHSHSWQKVLNSIESIRQHGNLVREPQLRQLTIISCGLRNHPKQTTDPETIHRLTTEALRNLGATLEHYHGHIASRVGNQLIAYFGYPEPMEFAASTAVHAGLACVDEIEGSLQFSVQVGVHAGTVIVATDQNNDIIGDLPDTAVRIRGLGILNTVTISGEVRDLLAGSFETEPLEHSDHSFTQQLYRITSAKLAADNLSRRGSNLFLGREEEMQLMSSRWTKVCNGSGQVVFLVGEPGIGKSRLVAEFSKSLENHPHIWVQAGADPIHNNSPFYAANQLLEAASRTPTTDSTSAWLQRLRTLLDQAGIDSDAPLTDAQTGIPPEEKRNRILTALLSWLLSAPVKTPLVAVFEDLHWLDPSSLELVRLVADQSATSPILLLCTTRAEGRPDWPFHPHHLQLAMDHLSETDTAALIEQIEGVSELNEKLVPTIIERSGGVPLFAEELARLMVERGEGLTDHEIPFTLQDSLQARLDRLGPARRIAQFGAVIGQRFSYRVLLQVSQTREASLRSALTTLIDADLLYVRGTLPEVEYEFKHGLVRDAAYRSLLGAQRSEIHERVGETLCAEEAQLVAEHPEVLAVHWAGANRIEEAIAAWKRASQQAAARYAYPEAEKSVRAALQLVDKLSDEILRDSTRLKLLGSLVAALQINYGYSAPLTRDAAKTARDLAEGHGDIGLQFTHTYKEWAAASSAGDYIVSSDIAERLLSLAQITNKHSHLAGAYTALVTTGFRTGDLDGAEASFATGIPYFETERFTATSGAVPQVYGNAAINAFIMGCDDEAVNRIRRVENQAMSSENPYDAAFCLHMAGRLNLMRGIVDAAERLARRCIEISSDRGFPQFAATGRIVLGRATAILGSPDAGLELQLQGLEDLKKTGNRAALTHYLNWLAQTHVECGDLSAAIRTIDESLKVNPNELSYRPDSFRIQAELLLKAGQVKSAAESLENSLTLATSMHAWLYRDQAKSLEQRIPN